VAVDGNRVTCKCTATDGDGRVVGRGSTVQVAMPKADLEARIGPAARDRRDAARR
jgi:predicted thioesterase